MPAMQASRKRCAEIEGRIFPAQLRDPVCLLLSMPIPVFFYKTPNSIFKTSILRENTEFGVL